MKLPSHVQSSGASLHGHAVFDESVNVNFLPNIRDLKGQFFSVFC